MLFRVQVSKDEKDDSGMEDGEFDLLKIYIVL